VKNQNIRPKTELEKAYASFIKKDNIARNTRNKQNQLFTNIDKYLQKMGNIPKPQFYIKKNLVMYFLNYIKNRGNDEQNIFARKGMRRDLISVNFK